MKFFYPFTTKTRLSNFFVRDSNLVFWDLTRPCHPSSRGSSFTQLFFFSWQLCSTLFAALIFGSRFVKSENLIGDAFILHSSIHSIFFSLYWDWCHAHRTFLPPFVCLLASAAAVRDRKRNQGIGFSSNLISNKILFFSFTRQRMAESDSLLYWRVSCHSYVFGAQFHRLMYLA